MARSSGGGSRSGCSGSGSRSSSSSRSSGGGNRNGIVYTEYSPSIETTVVNGTITSNTSFVGSRKFRYYRNGSPVYIYSNQDLTSMEDPKPRWFALIFFIPFIAVFLSLIIDAFNIPQKPLEAYNPSNVAVIDAADVFSSQEEEQLSTKLKEFCDTTGITTQILTIEPEEWMDNGSLENYAYHRYYVQFDNEDSWLIVYSEQDQGQGEWFWEGIQGDNTIDVMDVFINDFNTELTSQLMLNQIATPETAFIAALNKAEKEFTNQSFSVDIVSIIFTSIGICFILVVAYFSIFFQPKKEYSSEELEEVFDNDCNANNGSLNSSAQSKIECRYCGYVYNDSEDHRCPNCVAIN